MSEQWITLGLLGYYAAVESDNSIEEIGIVRLPSVQSLLIISEAQMDVDSAENALLCRTLDAEGRKPLYARFDGAKKRADEAWKIYEPLPQTIEEAATWKQFVPAWERWWKDHEEYARKATAYEQDKSDAAYEIMSHHALVTMYESFDPAKALLNKLVEINTRVAAETTRTAKASSSFAKTFNLGATFVGTAAAILLMIFITRSITRPINRIIAGLTEGADQVNDAAGQIAGAAQQLAEGASEQASSLEETSSALEEMAAMTRTNAASAKEADELSDQTRHAAQQGDQTMHQLNQAMAGIDESSQQISKIIKVIEEIAFQTNLLALNAAVEAARAGEHGKGFAVVADEVRNLAQRAAQAAKETTALIEGAVNKSREGTQVATDVGKALGTIVTNVGKVSQLINHITKASEEQAQGVDQVNTAVSQMDKLTQQNASGAEESASAAEELSAQAQTVKHVVEELAEMVSGSKHHESQRSHSSSRTPGKTGSPVRPRRKPVQAVSRAAPAAAAPYPDNPPASDEGAGDF